jgi:methionyl-tRNA synthetase
LAEEAVTMADTARAQLEEMELSNALDTVWTFVRRLNRYVEEQSPWKQAKEEAAALAQAGDDPDRQAAARSPLDATLWDLAEGLRLLTVALHPFIPATTASMRARLGLEEEAETFVGPTWSEASWGLLPDGLSVVAGPPLFPRIEE